MSRRRRSAVSPFRVTFVGTDFTIVVFIRSLVYTRGNFLLTQCTYVRMYVRTAREKEPDITRAATTWSGMKWNNKRREGG